MKVQGFTLVELLVVVAIITTLTISTMIGVSGVLYRAQNARAQAEVNELRNAIILYHSTTGKYPPGPYSDTYDNLYTLSDWNNSSNGIVPYILSEVKADPWGNSYFYDGHPTTECGVNQSSVCSAGRDGVFESFNDSNGPNGDDVCIYMPVVC